MAPRTQPRRATSNSPTRFSRVAGQAQDGRRFARSASTRSSRTFGRTPTQPRGRPPHRRRQSRATGEQGFLKRLGTALPLGGSSGKRGNRSSGSLPVVGGLLKSLGKQRGGTGRGGKPAMLGLLGAGAAGAAVLAKRRKGSTSSEIPAVEKSTESQTPTPATQSPRPDGTTAG
jgi:hypothetical protein